MIMKRTFGVIAAGLVLALMLCACGSGKEFFSPTRAYRDAIDPDFDPSEWIDGPISIDPPGDATRMQELRQEMLKAFTILNEERAKQGLSQFIWDQGLEQAADTRADELMASFDNETRPSGMAWFTAAPMDALGENIYMGKKGADDLMKDWINAANDKENFMSPDFTRMAFAVREDGEGTAYWVALFGN